MAGSTHARRLFSIPEIGYVLYEDMKISKLDGEISMKDGVMHLSWNRFQPPECGVDISGDYDNPWYEAPSFDVDLDIKEWIIARPTKRWSLCCELLPAAGDAEGMFLVAYKSKGDYYCRIFYPKTETLIGAGEIRIANAKINGMKIFEEA